MEARSVFVAPRPASAQDAEDWQERQEEAADLARKGARESRRMNKVSTFLGQRFWRHDKTWPFMWWQLAGRQACVEMYFPNINLAVDRFPRPTSMDRQEAAFKASKLRENGIEYVALFPENRLKDLAKYA